MLNQQSQTILGNVIAKAWSDPEFKERLKAAPTAVLAEMGIALPESVEIEVLENTPGKMYLTLPYVPAPDFPDDAELEAIVSPGGHGLEKYTQHSPHSCCTSRTGCCG